MATPNMPSSAQDIINNFLSGGYASEAQANPFRVNVDPFRPPVDTPPDDTPDNDPCPEGYVYDPVIKSCVPIDEVGTGDSSDDQSPEVDPNKALFDRMKKDPSTIFGASNILDDYLIDDPNGNILLKFDPSVNQPKIPLAMLGDMIFGGGARRQENFTKGMQSFMDQGYGQYQGDGTYQVFNPQQYFDSVQGNQLQSYGYGSQPNITVGQAVDSVMNPQPQVYDPLTGTNRSSNANASSGSPIAEDMSGGLLGRSPLTSVDSQGNRTRNDTAYKAAVARNIERNKRNFNNSKFKEGVGFMGGR